MQSLQTGWSIGLAGFDKFSAHLDDLRHQWNQRVKPYLTRLSLGIDKNKFIVSSKPKTTPGAWAAAWRPENADVVRSLRAHGIDTSVPTADTATKAIYMRGGLTDYKATVKGMPELAEEYARLKPEHKEAVNRIVGLHEADELSHDILDKDRFSLGGEGHAHPGVVAQESNRVSQADAPVLSFFKKLRRNDTMTNTLQRSGKFNYGEESHINPEEVTKLYYEGDAKESLDYADWLKFRNKIKEEAPDLRSYMDAEAYTGDRYSKDAYNKILAHPYIQTNEDVKRHVISHSSVLPQDIIDGAELSDRKQQSILRANKRKYLQSLGTVQSYPGTGRV